MSTRASVRNEYAAIIDQSSPARLIATLFEAAEKARVDAEALDERADELRQDAQAAEEKGLPDAAEELRARAAECAEDAENRRGMAQAWADRAADVERELNRAAS